MLGFRPNSSLIERVLFDDEAETLIVSFKRSGKYIYEHVPRAIFEALRNAPSPGAFFNEAIKGRFPCHPARRRYGPG